MSSQIVHAKLGLVQTNERNHTLEMRDAIPERKDQSGVSLIVCTEPANPVWRIAIKIERG
jgi:hypothetical protein